MIVMMLMTGGRRVMLDIFVVEGPRRETEVDCFQGTILAWAERLSLGAPLNLRVRKLIKQAEEAGRGSPRLKPEDVETA
jgi:hypothetical protein